MTKRITVCFLVFLFIACNQKVQAQTEPEATRAANPQPSASEKNLQAYIDLLRSNIRQEKSQVMGAVMLLNVDDAAKFWPIYSEYDAALTKLNNLRSDNIKEYARSYTEMTDTKADELIKRGATYQQQRLELLGRYYERVKEAIRAVNAARFVQVEHQLLLIIDLQLASALPIVGEL